MSETPESTPTSPSPGRAFLVYSGLRIALLVVAVVVLRVLLPDADGLFVLGVAVLLSALLSVVLLRKQRDAFTAASMARADARKQEREARRARLDQQPPTGPDDAGTTPP